MELGQIVHDFAAGMEAADKRRPRAASSSTAGRFYQPGIGPFRETEAVALTLDELRTYGGVYAHAGKRRYPAGRKECDLALGELPDWAIEVKMVRLRRDNGDYEDTTTKKILSPYPDDRSAVTDCRKLASSGFGERRGILIYGFEDPARPIMWLIEAFELIAARTVTLGPRETAPLEDLVHPVFTAGHVWAGKFLTAEVTATPPRIRPTRPVPAFNSDRRLHSESSRYQAFPGFGGGLAQRIMASAARATS